MSDGQSNNSNQHGGRTARESRIESLKRARAARAAKRATVGAGARGASKPEPTVRGAGAEDRGSGNSPTGAGGNADGNFKQSDRVESKAGDSGGTGRAGRFGRRDNTGRAGRGAGSGTGETARGDSQTDFRVEAEPEPAPNKTRGRGAKKAALAEEKKIGEAALIGLLTTAFVAVYGSIAQLRREDHWYLQPKEAQALAVNTHKALETLPGDVYGKIEAVISQFIPWIGLALTVGAVTLPRIEHSKRGQSDEASSGVAGESGESFGGHGAGHEGHVNGLGQSPYQ